MNQRCVLVLFLSLVSFDPQDNTTNFVGHTTVEEVDRIQGGMSEK